MANENLILSKNEVYEIQKKLAIQFKEEKVLPKATDDIDSEDYKKRKNIIDAFWKTNKNTRFVPYRASRNPEVYPTIDDIMVDWDTWDKELERLKDSPFSVSKRLGVKTALISAPPPGIKPRFWNSLTEKITSIVGKRPGARSDYQKIYDSITGERLIDRSFDTYDTSLRGEKLVEFVASIIGPAVDSSEVVLGGNKVNVGIDFSNGFLVVQVKPISEDTTKFARGAKTFEITPRKDLNLARNAIENLITFTPKSLEDIDLSKYFYDIGHGDSYAAELIRTLIAETRDNELRASTDKISKEEKEYLIGVFREQRKELEEELKYLNDKDGGDFSFKYNGQDVADIYGVPLTREENLYISKQLVNKSSAYMKIVSIIDQKDGTRSITITEDTTIQVNFDSEQFRIQFENYNRSSAKFGRIALNRLDKIMRRPRSPPPIVKFLLANLLEIFSGKSEAQKYLSRNKSKKKITRQTIKLTKGPPKKLNLKTFKSKKTGKKLKKKNPKVYLVPPSKQNQNIVSLMNAEIYKYVRAEMSENTLQYRKGDFARSVKVLSAQENAAVQYTYKKDPYSDVFSPGKSYLATENRNPAKIIDAAIKRLGQDRFQKVFRTEEV